MIGQKRLFENIDYLIKENKFPKNIILCGKQHSGKRYIAKDIGSKLGVDVIELNDVKMETIRSVIDESYSITSKVLYIIPNLDDAQFRVKYILLKVLEERPSNIYFIITCSNVENLYEPIRSRCQIMYIDNYTKEDINQYINEKYHNIPEENKTTLLNLCDTFYEVDELISYDILKFNGDVDQLLSVMGRLSMANILKFGSNYISFKKGNIGYDLSIFFKVCMTKFLKDTADINNIKALDITSKYLSELSYPSVNRQMIFDLWVLDMRSLLNGNN